MLRVRCEQCGIKTVNVPWARPGGGFTLLFEALVMTMVSAMPVKAVARIVGEHAEIVRLGSVTEKRPKTRIKQEILLGFF